MKIHFIAIKISIVRSTHTDVKSWQRLETLPHLSTNETFAKAIQQLDEPLCSTCEGLVACQVFSESQSGEVKQKKPIEEYYVVIPQMPLNNISQPQFLGCFLPITVSQIAELI